MKKKIFTGFGIGIVASLATAALVFAGGGNGSFENGNYVDGGPGFDSLTAPDSATITDWSLTNGSIDWIGSYWPASDGTKSVDLNGTNAGTISENLTTITGVTYTVTFDLSGNPDSCQPSQPAYCSPSNKTLTVTATGSAPSAYNFDTSTKGNTLSNMMWESHTYTFVATGTSTTLTFASTIPGAFGPALDKVVVSNVNNFPVPAQCNQNISYNLINGTNKAETINGTNGNDLIYGKDGADIINGNGGDDCIVGGDGADTIHGNSGDDVIIGGDGADTIYGDDGNDKLYGEGGADRLYGGNGTDYLDGGANADSADGGMGIDTCIAETKTSCEM